MVPTIGTDTMRFRQHELTRRTEVIRHRREAREAAQAPTARTYAQVMRTVDEANVASRSGLLAEARRLFSLAYGTDAARS